jgi:hypothetical protein
VLQDEADEELGWAVRWLQAKYGVRQNWLKRTVH